jgi:hypothetical protein
MLDFYSFHKKIKWAEKIYFSLQKKLFMTVNSNKILSKLNV